MSDVLIVPPSAEFITAEQVRNNSQVFHTDEDQLITDEIIPAAREYVENESLTALVTQTRRLSLDAFPSALYRQCWNGAHPDVLPAARGPLEFADAIRPVRGPLQSEVELKYVDGNGDEQTLSPSKYRVDHDSRPARVTPALNASWPSTAAVTRAVQFTYRAGFGNPFTVDSAADTLTPQNGIYRDGDRIVLRNYGGKLPGGLAPRAYFVVGATSSTIQLANAPGGAAIDITSAGDGVHLIGEIPAGFRRAIIMLASYWFEQREAFISGTVDRDIALSLDRLILNAGAQVTYA